MFIFVGFPFSTNCIRTKYTNLTINQMASAMMMKKQTAPVFYNKDICCVISEYLDLLVDGLCYKHINKLWYSRWKLHEQRFQDHPSCREQYSREAYVFMCFLDCVNDISV